MGSYTVLGRKNQLYLIDHDSVKWLEFLDEKFEILINKGEMDEVALLVSENKFSEIKSNLLTKVFSLN